MQQEHTVYKNVSHQSKSEDISDQALKHGIA